MRSRKPLLWILAFVPAIGAVALATYSSGDLRSSGAVLLFSLTPAFIGLLLLSGRPWKAESWSRKLGGLALVGIVGLVFLVFAVGGAPEFLKEQFGLFVSVDDFGPRAIVNTPDGYVVVGDDADSNAIVWLSPDGHSWSRVAHGEVFDGLDVGDVITGSTGLTLYAHDDKRGPVVSLTSDDGTEWTRAGSSQEDGKPDAASENAGRVAIVGGSFSNDGIFLYGDSASELLLAEPRPHIDTDRGPIAVVASGTGFLSAVNHKSDAVVFTSADGSQWVEQARFERAEFASLAEYGAGFVAVGWDRAAESPAIWMSSDGQDWNRSQQIPQDTDDIRFDFVFAAESGLLIIGHRHSNNSTAMWQSNDGEEWESVASPFGDAVIRDAVVDDSMAVVVGVDRAMNAAAIWTRDESAGWTRVPHDDILFAVD